MRKTSKKAPLEPPMVVSADKAAEVFPAVRYFQIHFEFLQEQLQLVLRNQEALQQQIQALDSRLSPSGLGIQIVPRTLSKLERLTAGHSTALDGDMSRLNRTGKR